MTIQIGRGKFEPNPINRSNFELSYFRYKDSISQDINSADLVISHAGKKALICYTSLLQIKSAVNNNGSSVIDLSTYSASTFHQSPLWMELFLIVCRTTTIILHITNL